MRNKTEKKERWVIRATVDGALYNQGEFFVHIGRRFSSFITYAKCFPSELIARHTVILDISLDEMEIVPLSVIVDSIRPPRTFAEVNQMEEWVNEFLTEEYIQAMHVDR